MPRPKEFHEEKALDQAMQVFWHRGFEATSIEDLVKGMGINRQSLYDTFGDKEALFFQAFDHYQQVAIHQIRSLLNSEGSPLENIRRLFAYIVERNCNDEKNRGCLLINTAVERATHCPKTAQIVTRAFQALEDAFYENLKNAKEKGELPPKKDLRALSRFLVGIMQGLAVSCKVTPDRQRLKEISETALAVLD